MIGTIAAPVEEILGLPEVPEQVFDRFGLSVQTSGERWSLNALGLSSTTLDWKRLATSGPSVIRAAKLYICHCNPVEQPNHSKSGRDVGVRNVERLRAYIAGLEAEGKPLPRRANGTVNKSVIALACGFDRGVFRDNPAASQLLKDASGEVAGQDAPAPVNGRQIATARALDAKDDRIQSIEERLVSRDAENDELRRQVRDAEQRLARYALIEEHIVETGKRIIL